MSFDSISKDYNVSRETYAQLTQFCELIEKWQKTLNLISASTLPDLWNRHIIDSLQLLPLIPQTAQIIYDIGSGGGFPALPLAIVSQRPFTLIESDQRKAVFLREAIRQLHLNATVISNRVETLAPQNGDLVMARACAPLVKLLGWASPLLSPNGKCLFPKGAHCLKEIEEAQAGWAFDCEHIASRTHTQATIVLITQLHRRS